MLAGNLLQFVTLAAITTIALAHSRMSNPAPRDPNAIFFGSSQNNCESTNASPKATYQRGQQIDINWARNNHAGGFIRLSVVPMSDSNTPGAFEKTDNIEQLHCHESGCGSSDPLNMPGMLFGDPPGKNGPYQNTCTKTFTIPAHLADGTYTLQWLWYGPGDHYGNINESEGEYRTCHDFTVSGGAAVQSKPSGTCPVYKGGDVHQQSDKCLYMYATEPSCTVDSQQEDGHMLWNCGGQTHNLTYSFGYPYPDLFKTCTKPKRRRRNLRNHHKPANVTGDIGDIKVVQGLDKYYT